jgi:large subunit ribosomal protein L24
MKIKKGDKVQIVSGKDRGKSGTVLHVFPERDRISIEGINVYKKRVRPKRQGQKGETVSVARPLAASNVMLVCPSCGKPTRIGAKVEGGRKSRVCKKCGATI